MTARVAQWQSVTASWLWTQLKNLTVICFVSISAKFGICTVVDLNGTLVQAKIRKSSIQLRILATTGVPFIPTKVQMPTLALLIYNRD